MSMQATSQPARPVDLADLVDAGPGADAWAEFRVDDRAERLQLLQRLRDGAVPVALNAPHGTATVSTLWSIDAARQQLGFCADGGGVQMQRLAQCDEAMAVAYLDRIKLQFELHDLVLVRGAHSCALRAQLPQVLYRFQRRGSYRVRAPEPHAPQAVLRHPSLPEMRLSLRLVDLSASGCALTLPDDVPALQPGSQLGGVRIELDARTAIEVTLRLQHVSAVYGGGRGTRLGCEFVDLDGQTQRTLQRFIDRTQQQQRLLSPR